MWLKKYVRLVVVNNYEITKGFFYPPFSDSKLTLPGFADLLTGLEINVTIKNI